MSNSCPNCGYCPHCGRSEPRHSKLYPSPYQPIWTQPKDYRLTNPEPLTVKWGQTTDRTRTDLYSL